ncbi:MAG: 30S ribosomal protein S7 [Thermoanaerobaculaceae bacterium]|nr:30S ribosomal protein S7 [Thermoanaerobaculaceae bacterium]MDI9622235.1 30S ribosomal protein S7 [Acidobacteriota bacterium]NLH10928.1 30S ribosomal protein S7 [Holophagae bacterium]HPW56818.1 30S ribosomal protein S7 [Thermoanaerobaculaceae bacterium]
MPRRRYPQRREVIPDPIFNSQLVTRFINAILRQGKRTVAEGVFYGALDIIQARTQDDPLKVFKRAVDNVKPQVEVKSRRVGGSTYQVPVEVPPGRQLSLSFRWLIDFSKARGEKSMREKLAGEFIDAANNRGGAIKKKDDTHRMAEANKAFSHYRW